MDDITGLSTATLLFSGQENFKISGQFQNIFRTSNHVLQLKVLSHIFTTNTSVA